MRFVKRKPRQGPWCFRHARKRPEKLDFGVAYRLLDARLRTYVSRTTRQAGESLDEIVQRVWIAYWKTGKRLTQDQALAYLCGIAKRKVIDYHQEEKRDRHLPICPATELEDKRGCPIESFIRVRQLNFLAECVRTEFESLGFSTTEVEILRATARGESIRGMEYRTQYPRTLLASLHNIGLKRLRGCVNRQST